MASKKKLRCFVAMAIGHDDTDRLYDDVIKRVLKELDVIPIRVDRREFNDDIDQKIVELIDESDFCIADLTYARQSVYYEAGYAQRKGPVVLTARKDHLHHAQTDDNLRVHFDLRNRNIIQWSQGLEDAFAKKLGKRLKSTVISPLRRDQRTREMAEKEKAKFASLSMNDKLSVIRTRIERLAIVAGFEFEGAAARKQRAGLRKYVAWRVVSDRLQVLMFDALPTVTNEDLKYFFFPFVRPADFDQLVTGRTTREELHILCFSPEKISLRRISTRPGFRNAHIDQSKECLVFDTHDYEVREGSSKGRIVETLSFWYFRGGLDSESSIEGAIRGILQGV